MKKNLKKILGKKISLYLWRVFVDRPYNIKREKEINDKNDSSIMEYKKIYGPRIFIETGTYEGDMVNRMKDRFEKIYSIELGDKLYKKAVRRFARYTHIKILNGDSAVVLPKLLTEINEPALFWLDAHYSTGKTVCGDICSPIEKELKGILNHKINRHIIIIDDARCFIGKDGYPKRDTLEKLVRSYSYEIDMQKDNFRIYPKNL